MSTLSRLLSACALSAGLAACGDPVPPAERGASPPADAPALDTDARRLSYTIGYQIGAQLRADGLPFDAAILAGAVQDALTGAPPRLSAGDREAVVNRFEAGRVRAGLAEAERNRNEGAAFLAANRNNPDVVELPSGLQYRVVKPGKGRTPQPSDQIRVHYRGTLIDGTEFDSSYARGEPAVLGVGQVIEGWQQALVRMQEGARWQVFVPSGLAYGSNSIGDVIGPDATLIFDIELLGID